jgi:hypothetical protein
MVMTDGIGFSHIFTDNLADGFLTSLAEANGEKPDEVGKCFS